LELLAVVVELDVGVVVLAKMPQLLPKAVMAQYLFGLGENKYMRYLWKISELKGDEKAIFQAKYHVALIEDDLRIETEGYWDFDPKKAKIPTSQVTEEMVANWIDEGTTQDGVSSIKSRLLEQLEAVKKQQEIALPWKPPTFRLS
jgi:hypothetical protein